MKKIALWILAALMLCTAAAFAEEAAPQPTTLPAVDGYERGTKTVADKVAEVAAASGISSDELREKVDAARVRMDELRTSLSDAVATASAQVVDVMNTVTEQVSSMADAAADANGTPAEAVRVEVVEDVPAETDAE